MYCPTCGIANDDANNYCHVDGQSLSVQKIGKLENERLEFCSSCGAKNGISSTYCQSCGTDVTRIKAASAGASVFQKAMPTLHSTTFVLPKLKDASTKQSLRIGLIGAAIAMILMMIIGFGTMNYVEKLMIREAAESGERITGKMLRTGSFIEDEVLEEFDVKLKIPQIYGVTTAVALLNGVSVEGGFSLSHDDSYGDTENIELVANNVFSIGLIAVFVVLIGMGVFIGVQTRREDKSIIVPVATGIVAYAIFVVLCSWIANFTYSIGPVGYMDFVLDANLTFGALASILKTSFIGIIVAGLVAFITKYGKQSFMVAQRLPTLLKYSLYSSAMFVSIYLAVGVYFYIYLQMNENALSGSVDSFTELPYKTMLGAVLLPQFLQLAHFSSIGIDFYNGFGQIIRGSFSIFTSKNDLVLMVDSSLGAKEQMRAVAEIKGSIWIMLKFVFLLPLGAFVYAGYKLFTNVRVNAKQMAIFAAIYATVLTLASVFSQVSLSATFSGGLTIGASFFSTLLFSFLIAFIGLAFGAFLQERRRV